MTERGENEIRSTENIKLNQKVKKYRYVSDGRVTKEVVIGLRNGDPEAFDIIYLTYKNIIEKFLERLTGSHDHAQEATQEIFVYLWEKHEKINPDQSIMGYLFRAARNEIYKSYRNISKYGDLPFNYDNDLNSVSLAPDEEIIAKETKLLLDIAVANMPEQRQAVYRLNEQGLSYEEIADKLNITKENARKHLSLARKDLTTLRNLIAILIFMS